MPENTAQEAGAEASTCDINISFAAPVAVKAAAPGKIPTFDADAYTGGAMNLEGFDYPVVIDYAGLDLTLHDRPVLRDHDPERPIGHTTAIQLVGSVLKAVGLISVKSKDAEEVVAAAGNRFPWQVSIGAKVLKSQTIPRGQSAIANGRSWDGPVIIARQTSLREISFLSLGADDNTSARIAARAAEGSKMKKKFAAWARARGIQMKDMEDPATCRAAQSLYQAQCKADPEDPSDEDAEAGALDPEIKTAAPPLPVPVNPALKTAADDAIKDLRAAMLAERQRLTGITAKLDEYRPQVDAVKFADIEAKAMGGEFTIDQAELALIRARRPERHAPNVNTGNGSAPDGTIIAAAAARSMGVGEKVAYQGLSEQAGNIAASMQGLTIHGIIAASAARLGIHCAPGGIDDAFLRDFLRADKESHRTQMQAHRQSQGTIRAASTGSGFSTMSLTGIGENVLYKALIESYTAWPSIVSDIAYERDAQDFRPYKVYRLTGSGDFAPIGPTGELHVMSLQDESYAGQVKTSGVLMTLKREDIINDDMGALLQAPQIIGRKAAMSRERQLITNLLAGLTTVAPGASVGKTANAFNFFSTGAKNYISGAGSALSIAGLTLAETKMMQQTDASGDPVGIMGNIIVVPPELKTTAYNLFNGANLTVQALDLPAQTSGTSAAQSGKQIPNLNAFAGRYRPVVTPYLGASSPLAGSTATQWLLLGSPVGGMSPIQVGYLRGQRTPVIRQVEMDAMVLGIGYQAIYDFGISLLDYRTAIFSAGV